MLGLVLQLVFVIIDDSLVCVPKAFRLLVVAVVAVVALVAVVAVVAVVVVYPSTMGYCNFPFKL